MNRFRISVAVAALCTAFLACASAAPAGVGQLNRARDADRSCESARELARNKATARRVYEEGLSQGRFEVPYTANFVGHGGAVTFSHADGMAEARGWRSAFPDLEVAVDLIVAEGNLVSVRWTARGTNSGDGNGIKATGKRVEVSGTTIFRFVDGAIAEEWTSGDALGLMKQLGLLPAAAASTAAASATAEKASAEK